MPISLLRTFAVSIPLCLTPPPANGPSLSLLADGGAEVDEARALSGWQTGNGGFVAESASMAGLRAKDGDWFLRVRPELESAELRQRIALAGLPIDRPSHVCLTAFLAVPDGEDIAEMRLAFEDRKGAMLTQTSLRSSSKRWREESLFAAVPKQAVAVTVVLRAERRRGDFCDAAFDRVWLEPLGPGTAGDDVEALSVGVLTDGALNGGEASLRSRAARALAVGSASDQAALLDHLPSMDQGGERDRFVGYLAACADADLAAELLAIEFGQGRGRAARTAALVGLQPLASFDFDALDRALQTETGSESWRAGVHGLVRLACSKGRSAKVAERPLLARIDAESTRSATLQVLTGFEPGELEGSKGLVRALRSLGESGGEDSVTGLLALAAVAPKPFLAALRADLDDFDSPTPQARLFERAVGLQSSAAAETLLDLVGGRGGENERMFRITAFGDAAHRFRSEDALDVLRRDGLSHELSAVRFACIQAMAAVGDLDALQDAASDDDTLCSAAAVQGMRFLGTGDGGDWRKVDQILEEIIAEGRGPAAGQAVRVLVARGSGEAAVRAGLSDRRFEVRTAALLALPQAAVAAERATVVEAFSDPRRPVRVAAYTAVARARSKDDVGVLIARMAQESGTARDDLREVLVDLCGTDRGSTAEAWSRWWALVEADFRFGDSPRGGSKPEEDERTVVAYHGIPIAADRLAFVIDLSGSMREQDGDVTRLERAKAELIDALGALRPEQQFALIGFGTGVHAFGESLVEASPENVRDAVRWIEDLTTKGWTNLFDGLEMALLLDGVEAVYLLSDGGPSVGRLIDLDRILGIVRQVNETLFVRIHTIVIDGSRRARWFLGRLSEESGGQSVEG